MRNGFHKQATFSCYLWTVQKVITSTTDELLTVIDSAFNLNAATYTIQLWNGEFDDWVDLEDAAELNGLDKCKLQVILR